MPNQLTPRVLPTISIPFQHSQATSFNTPTQFLVPPSTCTNFPNTQNACLADAPPNMVQSRMVHPINARIDAPNNDKVRVFKYVVSNKTRISTIPWKEILVRASMLLTTTAQPTARAEAGTSYSHIAVRIGRSFIELEMNRAVEMIFPLPSAFPLLLCRVTVDNRVSILRPSEQRDAVPPSQQHTKRERTGIVELGDFLRGVI
jgi:hypothetical protein